MSPLTLFKGSVLTVSFLLSLHVSIASKNFREASAVFSVEEKQMHTVKN